MAGGFASPRARLLAAGAAALAYAAASHALMTRAQESPWALAVVLGPLVVLGIIALWRGGHRVFAAACTLAALFVAASAWSGDGVPARWLYLAQHAGVHLALGLWFGSTLRGGGDALITALARKVHDVLTPAMQAYTRGLTLTWTLYFVGMAAASLLLFAFVDFGHWSLLANLVTPALTAGLFVGEHLVRYWLHPEFERVSVQRALQAWRGEPVAADSARAALDR